MDTVRLNDTTVAPSQTPADEDPVLQRLIVWAAELGVAHNSDPSNLEAYGIPDRFVNLERVGSGQFGTVFRAEESGLERFVAIKVIEFDGAARDAFLREAKAAATVKHNGVVTIHYAEITASGFPIIVMDYVPWTLPEFLSQTPLSQLARIQLIATVAEAAGVLHERGLVHRDLKPENILVDEFGNPKISDFGLAIRPGTDDAIDAAGTPGFMAPEQLRREDDVDCRADVFALGSMLHFILTGRTPVDAERQHRAFHSGETELAAISLNKSLPYGIRRICEKCLAPKKEHRFDSGSELSNSLCRLTRRQQVLRFGTVAALIVGAICAGIYARISELRQEAEAVSFVERVMDADIVGVANILRKTEEGKDRLQRIVDEYLSGHEVLSEKRRFKLELASMVFKGQLTNGAEKYLLTGAPEEVVAAAACMQLLTQSHFVGCRNTCQRILDDHSYSTSGRFRFCVLLALVDSEGRQSSKEYDRVGWLFAEPEQERAKWAEVLPSISHQEFERVLQQVRSSTVVPRRVAIDVAGTFATGNPGRLCELVMVLRPAEHRLLIDSCPGESPQLVKLFSNRIQRLTGDYDGRDSGLPQNVTSTADQIVSLALFLAARGEAPSLEEHLSCSPNPTIRTLLIHCLQESVVPETEYTRLLRSEDPGVRSACVLALGLVAYPKLPDLVKVERLKELFENDPDSGVHSACEWCLQEWGYESWVCEAKSRLASSGPVTGRNWFILQEGITFVIVRINDGELPDGTNSAKAFAVSSTHITCNQYAKVFPEKEVTDLSDLPIVNLTYTESIEFCNQLTTSYRSPHSPTAYQWSKAEQHWFAAEDFVNSTAFRLLTADEWEIVVRAGTSTELHIGECRHLLEYYEQFAESSGRELQPVGRLMPNGFGVFDALGNPFDRCQDFELSRNTFGIVRGSTYRSARDTVTVGSNLRSARGAMKNACFRVALSLVDH